MTWSLVLAWTLNPGDRVLDVCCGTGASALAVGESGKVLGVDVSHGLLTLARALRFIFRSLVLEEWVVQ